MVRDHVVESKPAQGPLAKPGEYEEIIKDDGVADKRLIVIEGEFVNALKVMDRLGNTLSPVIRQAWDGRMLNTMVKNSKLRCAAPHITIVGHITREELLSSLGRTEIDNGFANRFLWVAAKRSKILPEGGDIDTVDFGRVLNSLRSVIDFAQTVGEVRRAEVTRELWHADYIQLSEGKPGMVGSITGRAEAQVMRLSALFALLDRSKVILPVHHHAAMAVWKYCEDTVRWLFGNPFAQTEIRVLSADHLAVCKAVFNRPKDWIDIEAMLTLSTSLDTAEVLRWVGRIAGDTDPRYERVAAVLT